MTPRPRIAVRALLLHEGAVLLARSFDRYAPGRTWWELPGGGIDPGEGPVAALERELREETGYVDVAVGPEIAWWEATWVFTDREVHQRDHVRVVTLRSDARVAPTPLATEGLDAVHWVAADAVGALAEPLVPPMLDALVDEVASGRAEPGAPSRMLDVGPRLLWPPPT